ncbi:Rho GTPase-activating protein 17 [Acipenser ruthenus]|uniref:Rho GTPase-activating protein 17 n=1 Tax=Acipenser ruthenus TaxID=7906 RepID=A0A662Z1G7_ACIRT|nr:Rho GTPase-activating protein 17 [Acipenser ruthenus]
MVSHNTQKRLVTCLQGQIGTDAEKRHVDIPNIQKQRKQLAKMVLDWDSARARWSQASKSIVLGTNFQALTAKAETLKEEMDETGNKVELCKDQLAADMYNFFSKEGDYARYYVMLLEEQAEYHRKALAVLKKALPTIQAQQDSWTEKPAFGTALEEHLKRSSREIALPIEACVMMLLETGMKEEVGRARLDNVNYENIFNYEKINHSVSDPDKKLQALWVICDKLPKPNKANFRYLIKFLAKLAQESAVNKMTPSNIAIVLGPNLLWAKNEGTLAEMAAATSVYVVTIIEPIIQHADWFFPEEIDFNVSGMFAPTPSNHTNHHGSEFDSGTLERKRPVSMAVLEGDLMKKDKLHYNNYFDEAINYSTKKPAPAPPKPGNHPPAQPGSQGPPSAANQLLTQSPKPSASQGTGHSPPSQPSNQGSVQPHSPAQPSVQPRRHSSNQPPIQAPNHPPPQPPTQPTPPTQPKAFSQATGGASESGTEHSPPRTPTPPDTPPLVTHGGTPPPSAAVPPSPTSGHDSPQPTSPLQSNTLPRPRPVPKPRHRPSVPPPPQPPVNENSNGNANTASKIITDSNNTVQGQPRSFIPELPVEQVTPLPIRELNNHQLQDTDHDTESTVL